VLQCRFTMQRNVDQKDSTNGLRMYAIDSIAIQPVDDVHTLMMIMMEEMGQVIWGYKYIFLACEMGCSSSVCQ
jgi:hypothetical protein